MTISTEPLDLDTFSAATKNPVELKFSAANLDRIATSHKTVMEMAAGEEPVYGLNTGLGGNLAYRIKPEDIPGFQMAIVAGRSAACGDMLSPEVGRGILLYRIISAASGLSGISVELFNHLCAVYEAGLAPAIPEYGSIGASDLVQNGFFGLGVLGQGEIWRDGELVDAKTALEDAGLTPPELKPKEGLILISHSGLTVTLAAQALKEATTALNMAKVAIALSYEGYGANQAILAAEINELRPAPGQAEAAAWFRDALTGSDNNPRRVQEALSFRTVCSVIGAAEHALNEAIAVWAGECNGCSDSPAVLDTGEMKSTINFHSPALALALETICLSFGSVANGSVQRMFRMMTGSFSDLPHYLTPVGEGSAGLVPTQKTASILLSEIRHAMHPVAIDTPPIADGVEDMASMTPAAAKKLQTMTKPLHLLTGLEAMSACQAISLRKPENLGKIVSEIYPAIRVQIPELTTDRQIGTDINKATEILRGFADQL